MRTAATIAVIAVFIAPPQARAHLVKKLPQHGSQRLQHKRAVKDLRHATYVCVKGWGHVKRAHCRAIPWLKRVLQRTAPRPVLSLNYWIARQIAAATSIAHGASIDPWPNCPDPFFNGASWQALVNCENSGNWYDSPGYFRCGLQFVPSWENVYGRLCP